MVTAIFVYIFEGNLLAVDDFTSKSQQHLPATEFLASECRQDDGAGIGLISVKCICVAKESSALLQRVGSGQ